MRITIVGGCGRLGLSMAVVSAQAGHDVMCADVNEEAIEMINIGKSPISENGVAAAIKDMWENNPAVDSGILNATINIVLACQDSELIFVTVPTPSKEDGTFSIEAVMLACHDIAESMIHSGYKTIVIVSTVNPGDCENRIIPSIETVCRGKCGKDFGFVYSPEFIRQGSIMRDFKNPDMVLIGEYDEQSGNKLPLYYHSILENDPKFHFVSLINAEIIKLGLNTALVAKLAMANQITWLCHRTKGADAEIVLDAIGADSRIGKKFFKPGLPPGGPCLPRDAKAFSVAKGYYADFSKHVSRAWASEINQLAGEILNLGDKTNTIAILGMTYKPGVDIEEQSAGKRLLETLRQDYYAGQSRLVSFDPRTDDFSAFPHIVDLAAILVITTPHQEFLELLSMDLRGKTVFDCWGLLEEDKLNCDKYIRLGRGE